MQEIKQVINQSLTKYLPSSESHSLYELEGEELMVANNHRLNLTIKRFDAGATKELTKRLGAISESIGVKQITKEPIKYLVEILEKEYSDFTLQDIDTAFRFAFAGKLEIDIKKVTHFQSFDVTYVCPILNAYRDYRNAILIKQNQLINQKKLAEEQRIDIHDPELQKQSYERLLKFIQENKKFPAGWNWEMVFHHLERVKLLTDTNEEKQIFLENVMAEINEECKGDYKKAKEIIADRSRLVLECRKRRVQTYLKSKHEIL